MRYALMASIAPSERLRRGLDQIVAGVGDEHDPIEMIAGAAAPATPPGSTSRASSWAKGVARTHALEALALASCCAGCRCASSRWRSRRADRRFADPVALSSTKPGNFPASALRRSPYSLRAGLQPNRAPWSAQPER
jgi:hypothetical protein